jgi:hypothetical protein
MEMMESANKPTARITELTESASFLSGRQRPFWGGLTARRTKDLDFAGKGKVLTPINKGRY